MHRGLSDIKQEWKGSIKNSQAKKSLLNDIENELYCRLTRKRKTSQKAYSKWLHFNALKIVEEKNMEEIDKWNNVQFKVSYDWMRRSTKKIKIKFRKCKCGKERTAIEYIIEFKYFLHEIYFHFFNPQKKTSISIHLGGYFLPIEVAIWIRCHCHL